MAQPSRSQRARKGRKQLWKNGLMVAGAGAGLLVLASAVAGKHPFVATAVSMPAWWALGLGALLMLLHFLARLTGKRRPSRQAPPMPPQSPLLSQPLNPPQPRKPPQPASAIKALIDQIERETLGMGTPSEPPSTWEPDATGPVIWREEMLTSLDEHRFVALCEALFAQVGFATRLTKRAHGDGTDIWLEAPDLQGPVALVHCQPAKGGQVGTASVRALQKKINTHGLRWGACTTRASCSAPAMALAARCGIHVLETHELQILISRRSAEQQAQLLAVAQLHPDGA